MYEKIYTTITKYIYSSEKKNYIHLFIIKTMKKKKPPTKLKTDYADNAATLTGTCHM